MKKINRAVCGTVAVLGVFVAVAGLVLCMCETPNFTNQLRNMFIGFMLIVCGSVVAYICSSACWMEEPYAGD